MAKRGKKPFIFDSEVLEKIEVLASRGLAQQDIAYCIGIHPTTLSEKKYVNEQLQEALIRGKLGEIVISLPLFLRERCVNFCESLETVKQFLMMSRS